MVENIQTFDGVYGGQTSLAERNKVLRNTYWLLALSLVPTVLGAWMGVATDWPVSRASTSRGLPYVARRNLNLRKHHSGGLTVPAFASQM